MTVEGFGDLHPSPFRTVSSGWVAVWLQFRNREGGRTYRPSLPDSNLPSPPVPYLELCFGSAQWASHNPRRYSGWSQSGTVQVGPLGFFLAGLMV